MATDPQILLAANNLILKYGKDAEEHAIRKMWEARQASDETQATGWQALIDALKEVRKLRKEIL